MPRPTKPTPPPKKESFEAALFRRLDRIGDAIESVAEEIHVHAVPPSKPGYLLLVVGQPFTKEGKDVK